MKLVIAMAGVLLALNGGTPARDVSTRMAGPDWGGGGVPVSPIANVPLPSIGAISPGIVFTSQDAPAVGAHVVAYAADGSVVGDAVSNSDGSFFLTTPTAGPYFLEVVGTPVSGVPFEPGDAIVIVLP